MKTSLLVLGALLGVSGRKLSNNKFLQIADHDNDTDDIVPDSRFVALRDHDNDTDDVPSGMDPVAVQQRDEDGGWVTYMQHAGDIVKAGQSNDKWEKLYTQEEEDGSYELVQTQELFNHESDDDDIPDG